MAGSGISFATELEPRTKFSSFSAERCIPISRLGKPHLLHCGRDNFEGLGYVSLSRL